MNVDLTTLTDSTRNWARDVDTADVDVMVDGQQVTLRGKDAAAYLFAQSLSTVVYNYGPFQNQPLESVGDTVVANATFYFPPDAPVPVSLAELADALRYKYGFDPLIEFAPGIGLRGYSLPDINRILTAVNRELNGQLTLPLLNDAAPKDYLDVALTGRVTEAAVLARIANPSGVVKASATEAELREALTEGGDIYINRKGAFYINGMATDAMDVAVIARLLVQENIGAEYKVLMDEYAERNNLIAAAKKTLETVTSNGALSFVDRSAALKATIDNLNTQYGEEDMLAVLTAGKMTLDGLEPAKVELIASTEVYLDRLDTRITALIDHYDDARADAEIRRHRYSEQGLDLDNSANIPVADATFQYRLDLVSQVDVVIEDIDRILQQLYEGLRVVRVLNDGLSQSFNSFKEELEVQKTRVGTDNVFQWLRNFDVDPDYLWQGDWETLPGVRFFYGKITTDKVSGQIDDIRWYFTYNNLPVYEETRSLTIGGDNNLFPFDWTQNNWGWFTGGIKSDDGRTWEYGPDPYFNDANIKQRYLDYLTDLSGGVLPDGYSLPANSLPYWYSTKSNLSVEWASQVWRGFLLDQYNPDPNGAPKFRWQDQLRNQITSALSYYEGGRGEHLDESGWGFFDLTHWQTGGAKLASYEVTSQPNQGASTDFSDEIFYLSGGVGPDQLDDIEALLNTLISSKVRDGDLDQAKLQTLTAQMQNNTEAMTALVKVFSDLYASLSQALR